MGVGKCWQSGTAQHSSKEEKRRGEEQCGSPEKSRGLGLGLATQRREGNPCHRVSLDGGLDGGSPVVIGPVETYGLNGTGSSVSEHARACKSLAAWGGESGGIRDLDQISTKLQSEAEPDQTDIVILAFGHLVHQASLVFSTLDIRPDTLVGHLISNQSGKSGSRSSISGPFIIVVYCRVFDALCPWYSSLLTGRRAHSSSPSLAQGPLEDHTTLRCLRPAIQQGLLSFRPESGPSPALVSACSSGTHRPRTTTQRSTQSRRGYHRLVRHG